MRTIRPATPTDIPEMQKLFAHAKSIMRNSGNLKQWAGNYPSEQNVLDDIAAKGSFVMEEDGKMVGTFAFFLGTEPTYHRIVDGDWIDNDAPYGTIHRLACAPGVHGIARDCILWCERHSPTLRADTHHDNNIMQHVLEQNDFEYCGIIFVSDGTPRKAYQRLAPQQVCLSLQDFVEKEIIPQYKHFDKAHQQDHAEKVMDESVRLARIYHLNVNMAYAIAACHDLGLAQGRETHHLASGSIIRKMERLTEWFSQEQIETIAQAAEDHRASSYHYPRSIYGRIVAEADRDIEKTKIVRRTIQYGLSHYPTLDMEGHWQRTLAHLHEKYAEGGYLQLFIPESPNAKRLLELRELIADESKLRQLFEEIFLAER